MPDPGPDSARFSSRLRRWSRWRPRSIAAQLYTMLLALLIPLLPVAVAIQSVVSQSADQLVRAHQVKELALRSLVLVLVQDDVTKEIIISPERIDLAERKIQAYDEHQTVMANMRALTSSPELIRQIDELGRIDTEELRPLDSRVLESLLEDDAEHTRELYFGRYSSTRQRYTTAVRELVDLSEAEVGRVAAKLDEAKRRSARWIWAALVLGLALAGTAIAWLGRRIARRLSRTVSALERVAAGDLEVRLAVSGEDEIGRLDRCVNEAVESLQQAVRGLAEARDRERAASRERAQRVDEILEVVNAAASGDLTHRIDLASDDSIGRIASGLRALLENLSGGLHRITASTRTLNESSLTLGDLNSRIARAADQTSERVEGTARAGEEVEASVSAVKECADTLRESVDMIATGSQRAEQAARQGAEIAAGAQTTVDALQESSREVGRILELISHIASQTNLLALNASIEAATAGEAGRGFGVVANEVKELARGTHTAAREIEEHIDSIQTGTQTVVASIERLNAIAGQVLELQTTIAGAVRDQTAEVDGMLKSAHAALDGSRQIRVSMLSVEADAKETRESLGTAHRLSDGLRSVIAELDSLVAGFRTADAPAAPETGPDAKSAP